MCTNVFCTFGYVALQCSEESCSANLLKCSGLASLPEPCVPDSSAGVFIKAR